MLKDNATAFTEAHINVIWAKEERVAKSLGQNINQKKALAL